MKELLISLNACKPAMEWAGDKTWKEIFETCHRGDWLLWLFHHTKTNSEEDFALLTIAKGHCANTVRHLMKDSRSIHAVDIAMSYNGDRIALKDAADASAAADAAYTTATATAAADASAAADAAAAFAAYAAYADADADAARTKNQLLTADIVRNYIPIEKWNIKL